MVRVIALVALFMVAATGCFAAPFDDYTKVQKALISYSVDQTTVDAARSVFPGHDGFFKKLEALAKVDAMGSRAMLVSGKYSEAYFEFIKMPARPDVLADFMARELEYMRPALTKGTGYQGSMLSWSWSYIARAAVTAYQRTGHHRFMQIYLDSVPWVFDNLDSTRPGDQSGKIGEDGWSLVDGGVDKRDVTTVGRVTSPIIQMAIVAKDDDRLSQEERDRIATDARRAIDILRPYLKSQVVEGKVRYFRFPWTGKHEAMNHMAAFAESCAFAYKMTGEAEFRIFVEGFFEYFRAHVTVGEDGSYSWPYQVRDEGQHEEFFWKGAITVTSLINIHAAGIYLQDRDVRGIANSFDNYVMGQFYAINAYMGHQKFYMTGYNSYRLGSSSGVLFSHFIFLDEWRPGTKEKVLTAVASRNDLFPMGLFIHSSDALPYAYMLPRSAEKPSN